jgi:hypothetical protein
MKLYSVAIFCLAIQTIFGQEIRLNKSESGLFSLGARSTVSLFNDGNKSDIGSGVGGQFRLQVSERVNTEWFFDYLSSDIGKLGNRSDYHIGWSVLFYPWLKENQWLKPYFLAGHCFDYSRMVANAVPANFAERWSSAVQFGIGTHFQLTQRLDFSFTGQYMIHLGNHLHPEIHQDMIHFHEEKGGTLEGHLLLTFGLHVKLFDLW